jgi:hypothetical protein
VILIRKLQKGVFRGGFDLDTQAGTKSAKVLAGWLLAAWLVATVAGRVIAYTLPTKIQTAAAVLVIFLTVFLVGYLVRTRLGWFKSTGQGL